METSIEILEQVNHFLLSNNTTKTDQVKLLIDFVRVHEGVKLYDRKNFTGHITASAFIINEEEDCLLLLKHKFLNRWLQPGGHVDHTDENLLAAAIREAVEETGIERTSLSPVMNNAFDFDSHYIPENLNKREPGHYHHDIRYLFKCTKEAVLSIDYRESTDSKWISFKQLEQDVDFGRVVEKILNRRLF